MLVFIIFVFLLVILLQFVICYVRVYIDVFSEVFVFLDVIDSFIVENEFYDYDIVKVKWFDDKLWLGKLLCDIQKVGDVLREVFNVLMEEREGEKRVV